MHWIVPWAMALGFAGAVGAVLLHLIARRRPAAWLLPTARFIPDRQTEVSRAVSRPHDLLLLALRALLLLCVGAAFAQPMFDRARARRARVLLLDQSAAVADSTALRRLAASLASEGIPLITIPFGGARNDMSASVGSLTAALIAARRQASALHERADSVELVLLSPILDSQLDSATLAVRALWPGVLRIERVAPRADSAPTALLERSISLADPLGPALATMRVRADPRAVRLLRGGRARAADSAFARAGGTVVTWDSTSARLRAEGLVLGDDVTVAPLGRRPVPGVGMVRARWADGVPAAVETRLGAGCLRDVGIIAPAAGDVALRPVFQRMARELAGPCRHSEPPGALADSATVMRLAGGGGLASAAALAGRTRTASPFTSWLLGIALACALLELLLRGRRMADPVPA